MGDEDGARAIYHREVSEADAACRICYGEQDQGVMFRPCLCAGSMAYVHVDCLDRWRSSGGHHAEFVCPSCKYRYNLKSFHRAGWLALPWVVPLLTGFMFLTCIIICSLTGVVLTYLFGSAGARVELGSAVVTGIIIFAIVGGAYSLCVDFPDFRNDDFNFGDGDDAVSKVIFVLFLIYGFVRAIFGIYSLILSRARGVRNSLRFYVQDIRDVLPRR
jgi:hypothetical protein